MLHFITSQLTLTLIRMPTWRAYKCRNTTGKTIKVPEPKNAAEQKRAQQWLHNMSMGQDTKTFKFSRNSFLCEDHFHKGCIKRNLMYEHLICNQEKKI